jgi:hypothetical protein
LGTQDDDKQNNKNTTQKTEKDKPHWPHQKPGVNPGARERQTASALLLLYS